MAAGTWFWIIFVLFALLGLFFMWPYNTVVGPWGPFGWNVIILILIGLLGWKAFGPPVKSGPSS